MTDSSTHVIRLRAPWQLEETHATAKDAGGGCGVLRFRRPFGLPTGLQPQDEVNLVIETIGHSASVFLNESLIGEVGAPEVASFDIREQLDDRNVVRIDVNLPEECDSTLQSTAELELAFEQYIGEVRLEIQAHS